MLVDVTGSSSSQQTIASLPGGGFVFTWSGIDPAGTDVDDTLVWGRLFDASGAAVGEAFLVPDSAGGSEDVPDVGVLASGDLVFAWSSAFLNAGLYTSDTYARVIGPADFIGGTPDNDVLTGDGGNNRLYGYAGDDVLDGGTGNDRMIGGLGNETVPRRRRGRPDRGSSRRRRRPGVRLDQL